MKFSSQEEYGIRLLIRIGKSDSPNGLTIPEISELEGLSTANVAKILRILRLGKFVESARGQTGGYKLAREPKDIKISNVMNALGGKLFEDDFCNSHSGALNICTNSVDCSVRSLWSTIQNMLDGVLSKVTLEDLLGKEKQVINLVSNYTNKVTSNLIKN
ncbi:MAG: transcriptional regulator [Ignavibacteriales bacterium CG12_big_fil_rev_8_21_14_0_65_30_8]|nr:MAG: transcriptional regulator [Ignavibacteriales bacterium CG12_big_fil_rev_8_21_14_0_65_30_8]